jgi:hypothetical protein
VTFEVFFILNFLRDACGFLLGKLCTFVGFLKEGHEKGFILMIHMNKTYKYTKGIFERVSS